VRLDHFRDAETAQPRDLGQVSAVVDRGYLDDLPHRRNALDDPQFFDNVAQAS